MTFLGFIVAVLIIGGIFYAWYAFAGRTGKDDVAEDRTATARGAGRMRTSTAMETGTIGEPEGEQDKYVEGSAVNSGSIPRNVLNPNHGYDVETGTIGDVEQYNDGNLNTATESTLNDGASLMANNIQATGGTAGGATGQTTVAGNTTKATKTGGSDDLTSAIHQAFREEFYNLDDNDKTH